MRSNEFQYSSSVVTSNKQVQPSEMSREKFFLQLLEKYDEYVNTESNGSDGKIKDNRLLKEEFVSSLFSHSGFPSGSQYSQYPKVGAPVMSPNESFAPK